MARPSALRLLVVDDDALVREALASFFAGQPDVTVVGEAHDGREAVERYEVLAPDVVLMDLQMPRLSGIDATRQICTRHPSACIVAMTTFGTRDYVVAALRAGASGYLLKDTRGPEVMAALAAARAGEMPLSSGVRRDLVSTLVQDAAPTEPADPGLTPRERELTQWLAHGLTNRQIASRMHLSEGSVKQYLTRVAEKLGVGSRTQVLVRTIQLGIVDPSALPPLGT
ncbi:MAG: response regulator transcription factor [Propionibacteriaceae bacterium]|nr:response regulator transcription factor [Propionibacteriaceae bacterium]